MEGRTTESDSGDGGRDGFSFEEVAAGDSAYVRRNQIAASTQLFSFLALLNAYVPESYLLMHECWQILGPPDPIHGGPPFEERMEPFTSLISTTYPVESPIQCVCMISQVIARKAVKLLDDDCRISRSTIMKKFMASTSGDQIQPHKIQFIKHLLTKREMGEKWKPKFSSLIEDILKQENFFNAVSVLRAASDKFMTFAIFPQTLSRLHYIVKGETNYGKAEQWAKIAIERAPHNSYVADTLGQVHKRLLRRCRRQEVLKVAEMAFRAFKDVEQKATKEERSEMEGTPAANYSDSFNNRGHFGFIQVANIVFRKLTAVGQADGSQLTFISSIKQEVKDKFDFFEWYLTYSMVDKNTLEPFYFWRDVVECYQSYTENPADQSTSFAGLLDKLHRGLCMSKGSHAEIRESDLEEKPDDLESAYEERSTDVETAERYVLSNIILSGTMPDAHQVRKLRGILWNFLEIDARHQSPEFYLLVVLLFWPERQRQESGEEYAAQQTADDNTTEDEEEEEDEDEDEDDEDGEEETVPEPVQLTIDLPQYVTHMKTAFDGKYDKFLRGRHLLPLFFLGQGCGLSKWVHKSKLDAILEENLRATTSVPALVREQVIEMWSEGEVWKIRQIQHILLPVRVCQSQRAEVFVHVGGNKIKVTMDEPDAPVPTFVYLGFTIEGPVAFAAGYLGNEHSA